MVLATWLKGYDMPLYKCLMPKSQVNFVNLSVPTEEKTMKQHRSEFEKWITKEALSKIETLTTAELCKAYENTNMMCGDYVPYLRDWYMCALEERDEAAFIAWMETEDIELMDKPSVFFI